MKFSKYENMCGDTVYSVVVDDIICKNITSAVAERLVDEISKDFLRENSAEIISQLDMESIRKAVELKTINKLLGIK